MRSTIIKEVINNEYPLSNTLEKMLVLVHELENSKFTTWITNELNGYQNDSVLPIYRISVPYRILYTGINGNFQVNNQPLPISSFGEFSDEVKKFSNIRNSIVEIESLDSTSSMNVDLTMFSSLIYESCGISCFSITMSMGSNVKELILGNVKTRIINSLLFLEKEFGSLDEYLLDLSRQSENINKINKSLISIIYSDGREV